MELKYNAMLDDGDNFLTVFKHALEDSQELGLPIEIEAV